jgi:hypothetical protein
VDSDLLGEQVDALLGMLPSLDAPAAIEHRESIHGG